MSLELLADNWDGIIKKIIEPLWSSKFQKMYELVKLDKADFESLAGEELTKAFNTYKPDESNVYTYARMVIEKKAQTEIRDARREKRVANVIAESIYKQINDENDKTLEDTIEDTNTYSNEVILEIELAERKINKLLKPKEKKIVSLSIKGLSDQEIAEKLNIDTKDILAMRKRLNDNSVIRREMRTLGYLGGTENEV